MEYQETFTITAREETRLEKRVSLRKKRILTLVFSVGGLFIANILLHQRVAQPSFATQALVCLAGAAGTFLILHSIDLLIVDFLVARDYTKNRRHPYTETLRFDGYGVHRSIDKKALKISYDKLHCVEETDKAIYFFTSADAAWILPKKQMKHADEDLPRLRELLTKLVEKRKLKLL